jgi:hypothetical protein
MRVSIATLEDVVEETRDRAGLLMKRKPPEKLFRLSLQEILILLALLAMAIGSLRYATDAWLAMVMAVALVAFLVAVVEAAVDRGSRQAFAVGFVLCMVIYTYLVAAAPLGFDVQKWARLSPEMNLDEGRLPTTLVLRQLYARVQQLRWIDPMTGQEIVGLDPNVMSAQAGPAVRKNVPRAEVFGPIGHCWWALFLGYLGGWIARFVYLRRIAEAEE